MFVYLYCKTTDENLQISTGFFLLKLKGNDFFFEQVGRAYILISLCFAFKSHTPIISR